MEGKTAVILTDEQLRVLAEVAGRAAATLVVAELKTELRADPFEQQVARLRAYMLDPSSTPNPRALWASSKHIRMLEPGSSGKPKSVAWFQRFKKESCLAESVSRPSPEHGRLRGWTFADIAMAYEAYYAFR